MKQMIKNKTFDEERALYSLTDALVEDCAFEGEADGESAFKEARDVEASRCRFALRYPFWHTKDFKVKDSSFTEGARASFWYSENGAVEGCIIEGTKAFRECKNIKAENCKIISDEAFWKCRELEAENTEAEGFYFLFQSENVNISKLSMKGKYSFQYIKNVTVKDSLLDTKDAFWHAENVLVENCTVIGEYIGWYSKNMTFRNCRIIGTQPFCYCKGLVLEGCTMEKADLAFEYSDVKADLKGSLISVKNAASGYIRAESIGEIILGNSVMEANCRIITEKCGE